MQAPCRTFARALTQTDANGEVIVLDSAGYGPVTITQAVSISAPDGVYAGITAPSGNGVTINAGPTDVVSLRGLRLNGTGATHGIQVTSVGQLHVARTEIAGFTGRGINFAAPAAAFFSSYLFVSDSTARNNGDTGVYVQTSDGAAFASIDRSRFDANGFNGVAIGANARGSITNSAAEGNGSVGFMVDAGARASISDCKISRLANDGYAVLVRSSATSISEATVSRCDIAGTFYGIRPEGVQTGPSSFNPARVTVTDSTIHDSSTGMWATNGAIAMLERYTVTRAGQSGLVSERGSIIYISNSVVAYSQSCGIQVQGAPLGTFRTRGTTTIEQNNTNLCGTPTGVTPQ